MSGETEEQVSGWTVDTLKAHISVRFVDLQRLLDERFEAQEKAIQFALTEREKAVTAALTAAEKAVTKAEEAQLRVNETQNEFRGTLRDQAADLMPRAETELLVTDLRSQLEDLRGTRREGVQEVRTEGRAQTSNATTIIAVVIGAAAVVISLVALITTQGGTP